MKRLLYSGVFQKTVHWLLIAVTVAFVVSGFGITQFRTVETITFGLLSKNRSFWIHDALWIPFTALLALHIALTAINRRKSAVG